MFLNSPTESQPCLGFQRKTQSPPSMDSDNIENTEQDQKFHNSEKVEIIGMSHSFSFHSVFLSLCI
jgi:hypothetical protein